MLTLPIKYEWFKMIKDGIKKEEYREIKPYWNKRFVRLLGMGIWHSESNQVLPLLKEDKMTGYKPMPKSILFRNGYGNDKPTIKCLIDLSIGYGKTEWGAEPNKLYYVLKILSAKEVSNEN